MSLSREKDTVIKLSFESNNQVNYDNNKIVINRIGFKDCDLETDLELQTKISTLAKDYCFSNYPNCIDCPIKLFCDYGRKVNSEENMNKIPFIDLFCGAGGLSIGIEEFNFKPIFALDFDNSASKSYMFNRPFMKNENFYNGDIKEFLKNNEVPQAPIIVGGPPCQGFSNANRQRLSDDPRNELYKEFIRCVELSNAKICVIENVPGMLKVENQVAQDFSDIGFMVKPFLFNTKEFGYPQNRKRIFWLGIKTDNILFFEQVSNLFGSVLLQKEKNQVEYVLEDAIADLPPLEAKAVKNATQVENDLWGYTIAEQRQFDSSYARLINNGVIKSFLFNHRTKYNNERDIEIYSRLLPGEKSDAASIQDIMPYKNRENIFKDKYFKLEPNKVSKTITAHMYYDCHMYIHPNQARGLTPREAARVQGFPDNYYFMGRPNEWYRQVGNAVSPLASRRVGRALESIIKEFKDDLL